MLHNSECGSLVVVELTIKGIKVSPQTNINSFLLNVLHVESKLLYGLTHTHTVTTHTDSFFIPASEHA